MQQLSSRVLLRVRCRPRTLEGSRVEGTLGIILSGTVLRRHLLGSVKKMPRGGALLSTVLL